ncbi:hypothetical protein R1sor_001445 [Riccia sorocarpa]|uniref:RRM domain-containing protein n=1 Tax=Riccia sorocarpa TaxID=122646 RepID=A0ABD3GWU2_9MARC
MTERSYVADTSSENIKRSLQRLASARQAPDVPALRVRQVQITERPDQQEEHIRKYMQTAVYTLFFGAPPQFTQFKEYIDAHWASKGWIKVIEVRAAPKRGSFLTIFADHVSQLRVLQYISPEIRGSPSIFITMDTRHGESTLQPAHPSNEGCICDTPPPADATHLSTRSSPSSFVRLLEAQARLAAEPGIDTEASTSEAMDSDDQPMQQRSATAPPAL